MRKENEGGDDYMHYLRTRAQKGILLSFLLVALLVLGCACSPVKNTVLTNPGEDELSAMFPPSDAVDYYNTLEEAVAHCDLEGELKTTNIGRVIKMTVGDKYVAVFFVSKEGGVSKLFVYKFYVKAGENGRPCYSPPITGRPVSFEQHYEMIDFLGLDEVGEVRACLTQYNPGDLYKADPSKNSFWGVSQTAAIKTLRIDGQAPAAVIPVELGGGMLYFWYYDDLLTDKEPVFKDAGSYTKGEMVISIDKSY